MRQSPAHGGTEICPGRNTQISFVDGILPETLQSHSREQEKKICIIQIEHVYWPHMMRTYEQHCNIYHALNFLHNEKSTRATVVPTDQRIGLSGYEHIGIVFQYNVQKLIRSLDNLEVIKLKRGGTESDKNFYGNYDDTLWAFDLVLHNSVISAVQYKTSVCWEFLYSTLYFHWVKETNDNPQSLKHHWTGKEIHQKGFPKFWHHSDVQVREWSSFHDRLAFFCESRTELASLHFNVG